MFGGTFSILHWIVVLAVVLLLFGGRGKISAIMGDFGKGLRNFKSGLKGPEGDDSEADAIEEVAQSAPKKAARKAAPKKAAAKKQERRAKMEAAAAAAAAEKECGSSMIVHPPQTPRQLPTHAPDGWNTNHKSNEEYSLTPEERKKRLENKSRFSEFLRVEAAKRHSRSSIKTGVTNAPKKSTPQDTRRQKTKPPVPRLSALALGKKVMGKENMVNDVNPASAANRRSIDIAKKPTEKVNAASARNKERRKDYITFISKEPKERETSTKVDAHKDKESKVESNAVDSKPAIADDDSIFRLQMERIVQRAADLVIEKQKKAESFNDTTNNDDVPTASQSLDFDKAKVKQRDDTQQLPSKGNAESSCPDDATNLLSSNTSCPQSDVKEDLSLSVSVDTEIVPRVPVPMQTIANARALSRSRWTHLYDHNHIQNEFSSDDDSSSGSGLFDSDTDTYTASTTTRYHCAVNEFATAELLDICQDTSIIPRQPRGCGGSFEVSASIEDDFFSLFE